MEYDNFYDDIFAFHVYKTIVCGLLAIIVSCRQSLYQMDANNAFLNRDVVKEVDMGSYNTQFSKY